MEKNNLSTIVIGSGPAGLLFCIISKILYEKELINSNINKNWEIFLFDKRDSYIRNHRLRIAKENYLEIQKKLNDIRFDNFIIFVSIMNSFKRKYVKPEFVVVAVDNFISLQTTSDEPPGELPRSGRAAAKTTSPNPFEENSFNE